MLQSAFEHHKLRRFTENPAHAQSLTGPLFFIDAFYGIQWLGFSEERMPWSDCAYAQSDLGLRSSQAHFRLMGPYKS